jgi:hypothetical protein
MKRYTAVALMAVLIPAVVAGCGKDQPNQIERFLAGMSEAGLAGQSRSEFTIPLTGDEAGVTTQASGAATLTIGKSSIDYTIELNGIGSAVRTVSLWLGGPGEADTLAATLFSGNQPGPVNGVLAEGVLLAEDIQDVTWIVVVDAIRAGQAFVLVGTTAEPAGELRGQTGPTGEARFILDGSAVNYVIEGFVISHVTSAGIYSGRSGFTGPMRVSLFDGSATGTINGDIASGDFGAGDIDGLTLTQLIGQMRNGDAYVLVTTSEHPNGAMRGQVFLQF